MYSVNGEKIFVVDGHMHFWDAGPDNHKNDYGHAWIKCFYDYHSALSPADYVWGLRQVLQLRRRGPDQRTCSSRATWILAILNSTYLYEFFKTGFNTHQKNNVIKQKHPRPVFLLCGFLRPAGGGGQGWDRFPRDDGRVPHRGPEALHRRVAGATQRGGS